MLQYTSAMLSPFKPQLKEIAHLLIILGAVYYIDYGKSLQPLTSKILCILIIQQIIDLDMKEVLH